ncbi:DUF7220 family protein [Pseudaminobacter sp. NGMCC 1.201702]|uniref:DUF7220 family protein n=1 Tax=Pseudaminobacter sp. NGMCC 1.201702 TaxID=3391825 RepID=UPI0039EF2ABE
MKQSPTMALVETLTNVAVSYGIAVIAGVSAARAVHHARRKHGHGCHIHRVSVARSYCLRRMSDSLRVSKKPSS